MTLETPSSFRIKHFQNIPPQEKCLGESNNSGVSNRRLRFRSPISEHILSGNKEKNDGAFERMNEE